ncbi:helix-turn-helix transcriptional regulator [Pseudonocardia asaccharolytica]|uniref:LuxR family transcriptional regulator n=1 Tax=Pseudonocardia asaccharolytica DSM 44247 = NBRC 16224 TaxID=1123024 RepID=A0A511D2T0_9PSEU|nr:AAA family ATPase [Pseudonocardia asaccharolytica]GEL19091.1 LuxR family transcriptional regulator [Pseudonocardia asaccharolytica DSM 44247 = NBRC 16224]
MTRSVATEHPLLERDAELRALDAVIAAAMAGRGGALLVEGAAGIGKTRLLDLAAARAAEHGMRVLTARAGPLERDFAFGVVRMLLEPALSRSDPDRRARLLEGAARWAAPVLDGPTAGVSTDTAATLHGLHWLVAALAEERPLLLAADDLHWADAASLRALAYLLRRAAALPLLLALATRPAEPGAGSDLLQELAADPLTTTLHPGPLSLAATEQLVRTVLGEPEPAFTEVCHDVAAGNPLLLGALLRSLHAAGVAPVEATTAAVRDRAPAIVATFVLPRLRHLPPPAAAAARALALLGPGATLRHVAAVARLHPDHAATAVDQLTAVELLVADPPLRFAHPLLAQAVVEHMPAGERHAAHRAAARELAADAAPPEAVAAHVMLVEPLRDDWVVERLRAAADAALGKGAPQAAVSYLERALAEPPSPRLRAEVLFELGSAQTHLGPAQGLSRLEEALALTAEPDTRARVALRLARGLETAWELPRALAVLQRAVTEADAEPGVDPGLRLLLEAEFVGLARSRPETRAAALDRLRLLAPRARPDSTAGCILLAVSAMETLQRPGRSAEAVAQAERALAGLGRIEAGPFTTGVLYLAAPVLAAAGELDAAFRVADAAVADARERVAHIELGAALASRADMGFRRGALLDAEADARLAQDMICEFGVVYPRPLVLGFLLPVLVARGQLATAEQELCALEAGRNHVHLLLGAGRLRMAQDRPAEALEHLLAAGRRLATRDWTHPGLIPWETDAALAYHRLGRLEQARELADSALAAARRYAAPVATGVALRTAGLVDGSLDALREAVDVLAGTAARLEHAHALVEFGAALRRSGHRADAREPLRAGLDIAHRCAATVLSARATEELLAAGARPRRPHRTGVEALSPSERRVARLAADGLSNREIAQALFVTAKTVEVHLSACYRKLGIASRGELGCTMAP